MGMITLDDEYEPPRQTDGQGPIAVMFIGLILFCIFCIAMLPNNRHRLREMWRDKASEQETKN